ncbi:MAG: hypothetical protein VX938_12430, partial [Myxococcota bacterium]|nr:hypothetical protein [Myxococcota bacterium]
HREIGRWLEQPKTKELGWLNGLVGYHYYKGRDAEHAFPHLLALGRRAMAARVEEDAAELLSLSLEALTSVSEERIPADRKRQIELSIRADLVWLLVASGEHERAIEAGVCEMETDVPSDAGRRSARGRVLLWLGRAQRALGCFDQAQEAFEKVLEGLEDEAKTAVVRCGASAGLAACLESQGQVDAGAELLASTLQKMDHMVRDAPELEEHLADAYNDLGQIENNRGRIAEALVAFDTAFAHAVACHSPMSEVNALAGRARAERASGEDTAAQRSFGNAYAATQKWGLLDAGLAIARELKDFD